MGGMLDLPFWVPFLLLVFPTEIPGFSLDIFFPVDSRCVCENGVCVCEDWVCACEDWVVRFGVFVYVYV